MTPDIIGDTARTNLFRAMTETRQRLAEVDPTDTRSIARLCMALDDLEFYACVIRQDLQVREVA
jgi:hypothetical protein